MTKYLKGEDFEMFPLLSSLYDINNSQLSKLLLLYGSPMLPNVLRSLPFTLIILPCILQMSRISHAPALSGPGTMTLILNSMPVWPLSVTLSVAVTVNPFDVEVVVFAPTDIAHAIISRILRQYGLRR